MRYFILSALLFTVACEEPLPPLDLSEGCQPLLAGSDCMLPYPSDFFRVEDASTPSGFAIELKDAAKPRTRDNFNADVTDFRKLDGFSKFNPIVALLASPIIAEGTNSITGDADRTLSASSKTIIIDAETLEFVPHYVDVDPREEDPNLRAITLRPLVALKEQHRYLVALQDILSPDLSEALTPEGFRRLRDQETRDNPSLEPLVLGYENSVFAPLQRAGVERNNLQLAWRFTTGSDESVYTDMLTARSKTFEWLSNNVSTVSAQVVANRSRHTSRTIKGTVEVPLFLEGSGAPGAQLFRNEEGAVAQNGTQPIEFTMVIPNSVEASNTPAEVIFYGHGFFGTQDEVQNSGASGICDQGLRVCVAIDWLGMSTPDVGVTATTIGGEVDKSPLHSDRIVQAMMNWIVVSAALEGPLKELDILRRQNGSLYYSDDRFHVVGLSLGHVLGTTLAALHPKVERVALQVGGAGLANMMFRAKPFNAFLLLMNLSLPNALEHQKLATAIQRHWDRFDPAFWSRFLLDDELPLGRSSNPARRRVLMQMGVGDTAVPNFSSKFQARLLRLPLLTPSPQSVYRLDEQDESIDGSGFALFDFGVDPSFEEVANPSDEESYTHIGMRYHFETREQIKRFFDEGIVYNVCDGPCVLEPLY